VPPDHGRALALAGVVQAAALVHATAHGRSVGDREKVALLRTIFVTDPDSVDDVFPRLTPFREGIRLASQMLTAPASAPAQPLRYAMVLFEIEKLLRADRELSSRLGKGLQRIPEPDWDGTVSEATYDALSELYQQTISTLSRRVQVTGDAEQLRRPDIAARVRTLLLAGIRLAWLWHQLGGRRWHLVVRRTTIRHALGELDRYVGALP